MKTPAPDRGLLRTVLFSLAVVFMIIGLYQTVLENSLPRNYWLFMLSAVCLLIYRQLRPVEENTPPAPPAKGKTGKPKAGGKARRNG
ncbi:hypothetical protein F0P96_08050 [Hymenobacter busanensis]|uniref:Uncharacterized protein n=1 Tax=Hymenobacter busanensis TaxID=2607656 RepID=A0A7L4ZY16_9BACT|nr:hypothetical protein [Hymenobacter busanensis]KAA9332932.1 hypothetical protein F0P96_08050 [Hymenobacter busanensis]QHJ08394.1 hypothetical protein GUY19_14280 [Hymenobacter busanensis]